MINGLTDASHPCQIMADVMTYEEHRGPIRGARVVWSGDGNNVCSSFLHAAGQFGFDLVFTGPAAYDPDPAAVAFARGRGVKVEIERDPLKAAAGADLIVTDTWLSMHDPQSARERRHAMLRPYQVNAAMMAAAKPEALFMHCLPAHREEEVTNEVMDGPPRWSSTKRRTGCTCRRRSCAGASGLEPCGLGKNLGQSKVGIWQESGRPLGKGSPRIKCGALPVGSPLGQGCGQERGSRCA